MSRSEFSVGGAAHPSADLEENISLSDCFLYWFRLSWFLLTYSSSQMREQQRDGDQRGQHPKGDCILQECRFPAGSDLLIEILFCSLYEIGYFGACG